MTGCRKIIGLLIIIFIGIPVLIGVIWGVGMTRAVVSPEFLSDLPQDIIAKVPALLEETLRAVDEEGVITDQDERAWVKAIVNADTSPKELLEKIGVMAWLENELSQSLEDVGKILRGEMRVRPIMLNLRPLKTALAHEEIDRYLVEILNKLPACTDEQVKEWAGIVMAERYEDTPPACKPQGVEADSAVKVLRHYWIQEIDDIPDEVDILRLDRDDFFPYGGVDITRHVMSLTYLLFLAPAIIIGLAALIGATWGAGILRWIGVSTLVGGGLAFGLSKLVGKAVQWGMDIGPVGYSYSDIPLKEVGRAIIEKSGDIILVIVDHLFSTVDTVAGTVCIVGIVLIALSYAVFQQKRTTTATPAAPTPPVSPAPLAPEPGTPTPAPQDTDADTGTDNGTDTETETGPGTDTAADTAPGKDTESGKTPEPK